MHPNENKYDQMFRDRLRDLTHPVRNDLWSRIQSGIRFRNPSVPNSGTKPLPPNSAGTPSIPPTELPLPVSAAPLNGLFSATSLIAAAAAAALVITLGIIHFTHTATKPSAQPVNHYSTITPAKAPARSTGESSVTPRDSSRDRSNESATAKSIPANRLPDASGAAGNAVTNSNSTPEGRLTRRDRVAARRHPHHTSAAPGAHSMSGATETRSGATETIHGTSGIEETAAAPGRHTPGKQTPGNQTAGKLSLDRHTSNRLALPALARTSNRAPIAAGSPGSKYRHNGSNDPGNRPAAPRFKKTGYLSLYASPDFPNHNYTWSYTAGGRLTFQFSPHWSFTAGLEYARVNVPTQVIPPIGYGDTLHSFYFSNYEVPVLFGYTRSFRHYTLTVYGGAIINLYFHASTSAYIDNLPDRDSYGAVLGVEYSYSLGRHLALFAQPYARYSISDYRMFTQTQRWSFGTLLGIKLKL